MCYWCFTAIKAQCTVLCGAYHLAPGLFVILHNTFQAHVWCDHQAPGWGYHMQDVDSVTSLQSRDPNESAVELFCLQCSVHMFCACKHGWSAQCSGVAALVCGVHAADQAWLTWTHSVEL